MKMFWVVLAVLSVGFNLLGENKLVPVDVSEVYIPGGIDKKDPSITVGFDNNDPNVQVIVEGALRNTCYRLSSEPEIVMDKKQRKIFIQPRAYFYNGICLQVLVRYKQEINLGMLPTGKYDITVGKMDPIEKILEVAEAKNEGPDDYPYAPVEKVSFDKEKVKISGQFEGDCFRQSHVKTFDPKDHVVVILPIVVHEPHEGKCVLKKKPFTYEVDLSDKGIRGRNLLHVRAQNGQSVNLIENFD